MARLIEISARNARNDTRPARAACPDCWPMAIGPPSWRSDSSPVNRPRTMDTMSFAEVTVFRAPSPIAPMTPKRWRVIGVVAPIPANPYATSAPV